MNSSRGWSLLAAFALAGSLSGCAVWGSEGGPGGAGAARPTAAAPTDALTASPGADGIQRATVTVGDDLRLHPDTIVASPGTIEITFRNTGISPHDVSVDTVPPADSGNVNGGETRTVRVTVAEPGSYPMPCAYHVTSGMQGTLLVRR